MKTPITHAELSRFGTEGEYYITVSHPVIDRSIADGTDMTEEMHAAIATCDKWTVNVMTDEYAMWGGGPDDDCEQPVVIRSGLLKAEAEELVKDVWSRFPAMRWEEEEDC